MKKGKNILFLLALIFLFSSLNVDARAQSSMLVAKIDGINRSMPVVPVIIDGQPVISKMPSFIYKDRTLVPVRAIAENLGADVKWNQKDRMVTIASKGNKVVLKINDPYVYINGKKQRMPYEPTPKLVKANNLKNSNTMVPLRFVSETLGHKVKWDDKNRTVYIEKRKEQPKPEVVLNEVKNIKKENLKGKEAITIYNTKKPNYKLMKLKNPERVVIDILDSNRGNGVYSNYALDAGFVKSVRTSQFDPKGLYNSKNRVVRIVLDAKDGAQNSNVTLQTDGNKLIIYPEKFVKKEEPSGPVKPDKPEKPSKPLIVIDPGHGGRDPGAISPNGTREKDVNLSVSKKLNQELQSLGYKTIMTRDTDKSVTNSTQKIVELSERANIANRNEAAVFISIHANSAGSITKAHGLETLYCPADEGKVPKAEEQYKFAKIVQDEVIKETGANNRGVKKRPKLVVLNRTKMPAILIEVGFLTNPEEEKLITSDWYQNKLAKGIANGVVKYFESK